MLIVYRTDTGEVVDNTGTNSRNPTGPPDARAYVNTDRRGFYRDQLGLLRLHDREDADLVQQVFTHEVSIDTATGGVVIGDPLPEPEPPSPSPDTGGFLEAIMGALGKSTGRALLRDYPDAQIALDRARWGLLHAAVADMHADGALTDDQRDTVLALAAEHHIPEPENA